MKGGRWFMRVCGGSGEDKERVWSAGESSSENSRAAFTQALILTMLVTQRCSSYQFILCKRGGVRRTSGWQGLLLAGTPLFTLPSHHSGFTFGSAACLPPPCVNFGCSPVSEPQLSPLQNG